MLRLFLLSSLIAITAFGTIVYIDDVNSLGTADGINYYDLSGNGAAAPFLAYTNLVGWWLDDISSNNATAGHYPEAINGLVGTQGTASARGTYTTNFGGGITMDGGDWFLVDDNSLLSFGDASNDEPFTMAVFAALDIDGTDMVLSKREESLSAPDVEYNIILVSDRKPMLMLFDNTTGVQENRKTTVQYAVGQAPAILFTFTYDGRGGVDAADGIKIYTNGGLTTATSSDAGTYTAMHNSGAALAIAAYEDGSTWDNAWNAEGSYYDVMFFNKELTLTEITNLYDYVVNN